MNIQQIKEKPISEFLFRLGHKPKRANSDEKYYLAPYRGDSNPSLYVNDEKGVWFDHGSARGGNIIDLAELIFQEHDLSNLISRISTLFNSSVNIGEMDRIIGKGSKHVLVRIQPLGNNQAISDYISSRRVLKAAKAIKIIKEVYYDFVQDDGLKKRYFGAGWKNISEGYEVRSKYAKMCLINKNICLLEGNNTVCNIFEGMFDFLSALTLKTITLDDNNLVLNSLGQYENAMSHIIDKNYTLVNLFLDNDEKGEEMTITFSKNLKYSSIPVTDKRSIYSGYIDYNEFHCKSLANV